MKPSEILNTRPATPVGTRPLVPSPGLGAPPPRLASGGAPPVLVVFSHLRWSFVFQRPQQLLSRLAGRWRVVFVEEPIALEDDGAPRIDEKPLGPALTVLVPRTPRGLPPGYADEQMAHVTPLLAAWLRTSQIAPDVVWLYTPMALPLVEPLAPRALVYDCMDELSAFAGAPNALRQREAALLKRADLVITGGPSLYEVRRSLHPNVHCVPSSVDAAHFGPARLSADDPHAQAAQALQGALPQPRLGFYGVIDERFDVELLDRLALERPAWQFVMAGPVVKIDPAVLPRHANIHWLGMQPYERLPHLLAGWDVALMPFALNESTRFISPTKTLEYMAGDRPVVSTPIRDVISLYGHVVEVAAGPGGFVRAIERVLAENSDQRVQRSLRMLATVAMHSWERSADAVHALLSAALRTPLGGPEALRRAAVLRAVA